MFTRTFAYVCVCGGEYNGGTCFSKIKINQKWSITIFNLAQQKRFLLPFYTDIFSFFIAIRHSPILTDPALKPLTSEPLRHCQKVPKIFAPLRLFLQTPNVCSIVHDMYQV